jgi:hypothetical protein
MSFHNNEVARLRQAGGRVLERYRVLCERADVSAHDSPDAQAKAAFEQDWVTDPRALIAAVEAAS